MKKLFAGNRCISISSTSWTSSAQAGAGRETIGRLRDIDPGVRAVVSSGYANDPLMADHQKHGFKDVLPKPYKMAELTYVLHKLLDL